MKKILYILILLLIITGCNLNNTPTSKVEHLLTKYQSLDKDIEINYLDLVNNNNISINYKEEYEKIIKKQYEKLTYEVKEEVIDGDSATVTTEIEVLDYKDIITKYNLNMTSDNYNEKLIRELKKVNKKITYTIDFSLTKDNNDKWQVDELNDEQRNKLLGIY